MTSGNGARHICKQLLRGLPERRRRVRSSSSPAVHGREPRFPACMPGLRRRRENGLELAHLPFVFFVYMMASTSAMATYFSNIPLPHMYALIPSFSDVIRLAPHDLLVVPLLGHAGHARAPLRRRRNTKNESPARRAAYCRHHGPWCCQSSRSTHLSCYRHPPSTPAPWTCPWAW